MIYETIYDERENMKKLRLSCTALALAAVISVLGGCGGAEYSPEEDFATAPADGGV